MNSPVILHVPHASRTIPPGVRPGIALSDADLAHELDVMTDSFTDVIAARASESSPIHPTIVSTLVSRLVVDVERFTDGTEPMEAVGMGAIYTRTHDLRMLRHETEPALLDRFYYPHAAAVARAVDRSIDAHGMAVLIDLHSYSTRRLPYELVDDRAPRPEICLGTDPVHTPEWLLTSARRAFAGFDIALDTPFAGTYVPVSRYRNDPRATSIMIEIRRDQYMTEDVVAPHAGIDRVVAALAALIGGCAGGSPRANRQDGAT